jgi:very-short-patch-repair endonuclease
MGDGLKYLQITISPKNIVVGQKITSEKNARARELRHHMTDEEAILWQRLRINRLGGWHFRRQQIIASFIVDFYCHAASLVVEIDGPIHTNQVEYDAERDRVLTEMGCRVMRFPNEQVDKNLEGVLLHILQACKESK